MLKELYRQIPKIDRLLETDEMKALIGKYGYTPVFEAARRAEEELRQRIAKVRAEADLKENKEQAEAEISGEIAALPLKIAGVLKSLEKRRMHHVINATGIILHTNLGRAPLSPEVMEQISPLMTGYTNLEFDLETGKRGSRYDHFSDLICRLTGAEAAMAVNNNAGAVLLMLSALTAGREAVVSRGELIEIGGKFRIPEVMEQSGTCLVEVGTTNRTYVEDYERAVTENTAGFLKVHTSNYKIMGFTHETTVEELVELGKKYEIPVLVDLGSGSFIDFRKYGLPGEDTVQDILSKGADLVTFSGDKLLGGPQAGIIAGKKELIEKISRHPLTRALRIDKFTAAALEAVLRIYQDEKEVFAKVPALEMMSRSKEALRMEAEKLKKLLEEPGSRQGCEFRILETESLAGGGSMPQEKLTSICLSLKPADISAAELSRRLRMNETPVVARIENDSVLFDLRTVFPEEIPVLAASLRAALTEREVLYE